MRSQLINCDVATESGSWNEGQRAACVAFVVAVFTGVWCGGV